MTENIKDFSNLPNNDHTQVDVNATLFTVTCFSGLIGGIFWGWLKFLITYEF